MLLIIGFIIVLGATLGGFMIAGGKPAVLLHVSEFVSIGGIAAGVLVISTPLSTVKAMFAKLMAAISGKGPKKDDYVQLLLALFELFTQARRGGLIAIEDHIINPQESTILTRYPSLVKDHSRLHFLVDSLKPIIDGRVKPDQLETVLHGDLASKEEEAEHPVHLLNLIGDSLPGIGIVAAVLGIINTMASISAGPEAVGEHVAAALTGTFLGILGAYGFVNPLSARIKTNNALELQYFSAILKGVASFTGGMAPIMAVEVARRCLDHTLQPGAEELEEMTKSLGSAGGDK